jgi:hypothetical protein
VHISAALTIDLGLLNEALDQPDIDVADTLTRLAADTKAAVSSFLGLAIRTLTDGEAVALTVFDDSVEPRDVATSLRIALPPGQLAHGDTAPMSLTLYARTPGAFVDLAADLRWMTHGAKRAFVLDDDVTPADSPTPRGLRALSTINQAIGVLIGRGDSPWEASRNLDVLAGGEGMDRLAAATSILDHLRRPGSS